MVKKSSAHSWSLMRLDLHHQAVAVLALTCVIPALVSGWVAVNYVLPHAESLLQAYATFGCTVVISGLGSWLMLGLLRRVRALLFTAAQFAPPAPAARPDSSSELDHLDRVIRQLGESLRQQVIALEEKGAHLRALHSRVEHAESHLRQFTQIKADLALLATREFRTLIGTIVEATALALKGQWGNLNEKQLHVVNLIHGNATRAAGLLHELLLIARTGPEQQDFDRGELDVAAELRNLLARKTEQCERRAVTCALAPAPRALIIGYQQETALALECLLSHVIQTAREGSVFSLQVLDGIECVLVTWQVQPQSTDPHLLRRLTESLDSSATKVREWSGLESIELPLAKDILQRLGGRLRVEQAADGSLIYRLALPKVIPAATPHLAIAAA